MWALFDPYAELSDLDGFEPFTFPQAKRLAHKILNGRQHGGYHFRIQRTHRLAYPMLEQETCVPVNEKDLFDAIALGTLKSCKAGEVHCLSRVCMPFQDIDPLRSRCDRSASHAI
jgi:hypothetical protein